MAGILMLPQNTRAEIALRDVRTTKEEIDATASTSGVGRRATPQDTPIFFCELNSCYRLFPSRARLQAHRIRDHNTQDALTSVLTYEVADNNPPQEQMQE